MQRDIRAVREFTITLRKEGVTDKTIGRQMAVQFTIVLVFFVFIEIVLALISLVQCSRSKDEYADAAVQKNKILERDAKLCFEVAVGQLTM